MKSVRPSSFALVAALAVATFSLSIERAARADENEGPLPKKEVDPNAPIYAPIAEPAASQAAPPPSAEMTPMPALPAPSPAPAAPLAAAPAAAPVVAPAPGERDSAQSTAQDHVLQPWEVDTRVALHTTPLFQYGGIGASADAGMRKLGPGTLAMGGGMEYFACGTSCSATPLEFTQRQLSLEGRVSYHMALPKVRQLDFYPLLTAGFVVSRSSIDVGGSEYRASDLAPAVGFGAGASYFFADRFFVGAEARFRYATGSYSYELASGPAKPFDKTGIDTWNTSTVDLGFAFGARF
jgi:hypothetical protein